jgi:hypothetical protein
MYLPLEEEEEEEEDTLPPPGQLEGQHFFYTMATETLSRE